MARAAEAEVVGGRRKGGDGSANHAAAPPVFVAASVDRPSDRAVGRSVASLCALRVEAILPCFLLCPIHIGEGERYVRRRVFTRPDTPPFPALSASLILDSPFSTPPRCDVSRLDVDCLRCEILVLGLSKALSAFIDSSSCLSSFGHEVR